MTARAFGGHMVSSEKPGEEDARSETEGKKNEIRTTGGEEKRESRGPLFSPTSQICTEPLALSSLLAHLY